jgi:hypothetical protein
VAIIGRKPRRYRPRPPYRLALHYTGNEDIVFRTDIFEASSAAEAMLGCLEAVQKIPARSRERYSITLHLYICESLYNLGIVLDPEKDNPETMDERVLPAGHLDNDRLAILADALEDAGCTDQAILGHLRGPGHHVRGCWAVDALLGRK